MNKSGKFLVCYFVKKELTNVIQKKEKLHKEVLNKIENPSFDLDSSKVLSKRDIPTAKKLFVLFKDKNKIDVSQVFLEERVLLEMRVEEFLEKLVDETVVQIDQIKTELVNTIREVIENYADCNVLASALQFQQDKNVLFFVTADKEDFNPNQYDYLKDYGALVKYKFPELYNFHFIN